MSAPTGGGVVDIEDLGTVLGIWAHPDDDIYLSAAIMAATVRSGRRAVDVTATRGEGGSLDEERWPPASMAEVRTRELMRSLEILGVTEHRFLDGVVDVDMETPLNPSGADQVLAVVRDVGPDSVLTFGPDGMTGNAGHKDVSRWVTDAFHSAAPAGARLFYATQTERWASEWVPKLEPFHIFWEGPPVTPDGELAIHVELSEELAELKYRAIAAHESQVGGLIEVFGRGFIKALGEENFRLAATKEG